jgi:hypothetical protein
MIKGTPVPTDQLKNIVWNPAKDNIKVHIHNMKNITHQMTLLGDHLTDRDKTIYFMESLAHRLNLVKKIDLSRTFDETCNDIVDFLAKEKYIATMTRQHHHNTHPGVFNINITKDEIIDYDSDQESLWNNRAIIKQGLNYDHHAPPSQESFDFDSDQGSANCPAPWSSKQRKTNSPSNLPLATTSRNDWYVSKIIFPNTNQKQVSPVNGEKTKS